MHWLSILFSGMRGSLIASLLIGLAIPAVAHITFPHLKKLLHPRGFTLYEERRQNKPAYQAVQDGIAADDRGDQELAIALFSRAIELYGPDNDTAAKAYELRGLMRSKTDLNAALEDYSHVVRLEPDAWAFSARGRVLSALGRHEEALKDFDAAIDKEPNIAGFYNNRGLVLYKIGRKQDAFVAHETAAKKASDKFEERQRELVKYENHPDQLAVWRQRYTEGRDWDLHKARLGMGNVLRDRGQFDMALAAYGEAIRLQPNSATALINRGWLYEKRQQREPALADYERAASLKAPDDWLKRAIDRVREPAS